MKGSCKLPGKQKLDCGKPSLLSPQSLHLIESEVHVLSHASFELATQFYKTKQPEPCSLFLTSKSAWTTFGSWRQIRAEEMSSLLRNIKNLRFYPSCKLTRYPDVISWVLTEDTRLLSHKERLIAHSHSSSLQLPVVFSVCLFWADFQRFNPTKGCKGEQMAAARMVGWVTGEEPWVRGCKSR